MGRIEGKIAIVTGSTYGIGRATAMLLAKEGATSIITGRSEDAGKACVKDINGNGCKAEYYQLDVTNEALVKEVADEVYNKYGRIDILVNNAGVAGPNKPTHEYTEKEWNSTFEVNVTGAFLCTKHVVPYMIKQKSGSIVYISSIYGIIGAPDIPAYHATKAANRVMAKIDALLYAKDNIRVNSVHPGFIWTPMVKKLLEEQSKKTGMSVEDLKKELDSRHPIGHVGEPNDIAYGVLYLVSDEAKFVTGSELVIDGGYTST
ncbi:MAG: short chain dehydrogenase [Methanosaeta sp. PtaU1.Bin060]|jgi:NAD(P)-dependent dehydrogenase (short-subunit alcohol dehydrogenase family)|nr:MAG: short chain dehydrogenase [Methanosaeta sp. PtaU1.Bin060]